MQVTERLTRPLTEVKYLNADNVDRYRCIMRIFFENYEKLRYWMYEEDVFAAMKAEPYFSDYRQEQCRQDLEALAEWKNLIRIQDTRRVATLAEFNNRNFRYQMSEYSVEIERLVLRLENLFIEGASLEPTLLERIRRNVGKFQAMAEADMGTVYTWWTDLNNDFIRLNQNYQDYIRDLNSVRAEEMMRTREFLVFKDRLVDYLRNFIKGLQRNVGVIEAELCALPQTLTDAVFARVLSYELSIPRMDARVDEAVLLERIRGRFESIHDWFVAENGSENEAGKLFDATNDMIRRITRYAALLSERSTYSANRREEYRKVASVFMKCPSLAEAHKMSAMVFGVEQPRHLKGGQARATDSMNSGVYEEAPEIFTIKPRVRTYKEKANRSVMGDHSRQKAQARERMLQELQEEQMQLKKLEHDGRIDFGHLPVIAPRIREILLKWLSDALEDSDYTARTDDGRQYRLEFGRPESGALFAVRTAALQCRI